MKVFDGRAIWPASRRFAHYWARSWIMSIIKLDFDVDSPLAEVRQFGLNTKRSPEWQFNISSVEGATPGIEGPGQGYTVVYRMWERDFDSPVQITRFEPPHTLETCGATPIGGVFRSRTQMQAMGSGTDVEWEMEYQLPLGFIGNILDLLIFRRAFESTVRKYQDNFKAVAEGGKPPHPQSAEEGNGMVQLARAAGRTYASRTSTCSRTRTRHGPTSGNQY